MKIKPKSIEIDSADIDQYCDAYSTGTSGIARDCHCGKTYYSSHYSDHNCFDEGEIEGYEKNPNAFPVDYSPGGVYVLGVEYCNACDCWHQKAQQVINMLRDDKEHIAAFFILERKALLAEMERTPIIAIDHIHA